MRTQIIALCALIGVVVQAQDVARPTFEVVSIREHTSGAAASGLGRPASGRFEATNMPLSSVIRFAYDAPERIVGLPEWCDTVRYDIEASTSAGLPQPQFTEALRELLRDRFRLLVHTEKRDLPINKVVVGTPDNRPGATLQQQLGLSLENTTAPFDVLVIDRIERPTAN